FLAVKDAVLVEQLRETVQVLCGGAAEDRLGGAGVGGGGGGGVVSHGPSLGKPRRACHAHSLLFGSVSSSSTRSSPIPRLPLRSTRSPGRSCSRRATDASLTSAKA